MYKKLAIAALFGVAAVVSGCAKAPIETVQTENPEISYSVLFNRHGCEVGRFEDSGRAVYVTICPEGGTSATQSSHSESCGKNCTRTVEHNTMQVRESPGTMIPGVR